jgi:hypothetical protein
MGRATKGTLCCLDMSLLVPFSPNANGRSSGVCDLGPAAPHDLPNHRYANPSAGF